MQKYDHACNLENDNENCMSYVNARQKSNDFTPSEINLIEARMYILMIFILLFNDDTWLLSGRLDIFHCLCLLNIMYGFDIKIKI